MESWAAVSLSAVTDATGNVTQLYPPFAVAGVNPATAMLGQQIRSPLEGLLYSLQIETDGTNGGTLQIYDISGLDAGADVSSATVITATQLNAMITAGRAKIIYEQNFISSPETPVGFGYRNFMHGLAGRLISASGSCKLNMVVGGGFSYRTKII